MVSSRLQQVSDALSDILRNPESVGLGSGVPQPLAGRLEWMRQQVNEALQEDICFAPEPNLEVELSQDADHGNVKEPE